MITTRFRLSYDRKTDLIAITAYSDDKFEAAETANGIASSYRDYRQQTYNGPKSSPPPVLVLQITDTADPTHAVAKPNKPLNIILGGVMGAVLGLPVAGIAAFIAARTRNRRLHQQSIT